MIHKIWRLGEESDDNLGLACTDQGLLLGGTALIERREGRFVVRESNEVERLLSRGYGTSFAAGRVMTALATVAAALNANDQGLARIAAVHLRIPDLPNRAAREAMAALDVLIKYARDEGSGEAWNPALHPRAGTPPNPGWFAPAGGGSSSTRLAENEGANQSSDATSSPGDNWVRLRLGPTRVDELADFAEWLANATPEDEKDIRAEIKRYYADVGWQSAAHDLNAKLSVVLRPGVTRQTRQSILDSIDVYTRVDPAEYVGVRDALDAASLAAAGLLGAPRGPSPGGPSPVWKLGWAARGRAINKEYGDPTFPDNYPIIDKNPNGVATSVKSIDLTAKTYQKEASLTYRLNQYVADVQEFEGANWGTVKISKADINSRAVQLIVPEGSLNKTNQTLIGGVRARAMKDTDRPVDIIVTEH